MTAQPLPDILASNSRMLPHGSEQSDEGGINLGRIVGVLKRRWLLIAGVTALVSTLATIRASSEPPTFQAGFEILMQPSSAETEAISSIPGVLNPQNQTSQTLSLQDQLRILMSPGALAPALETLRTEHPEICGLSRQQIESGQLTVEAQLNSCLGRLQSNLQVALTPDSRIFEASYRGDTAEEVQLVAELMAQTFLDFGLESRKVDIQQGLAFLDAKLPDLSERVDILQDELQTLRQANNLITPDAKATQLSGQIGGFSQELLSTQVQLEQLSTIYNDLQQQLQDRPQETVTSSALTENTRYQSLIQQLLQLDSQIAEASTLFLDESPDMAVLKEQRENLLRLLSREGLQAQRELASRMQALEAQRDALSDTLSSLYEDVDNLADLSRQFTDIERELTIATTNLNQLLERREALEIEAAQRELPWELVSPPTVSTEMTDLTSQLVLGVAVGLMLGSGLAFAVDGLKNTLYSPEDLKRLTSLPILGVIPQVNSKAGELTNSLAALQKMAMGGGWKNLDVASQKNQALQVRSSMSREALRTLVANINLLEANQPTRSFAISSVEAKEERTDFIANLAQTAASMGHRVLLVDANVRSHSLHHELGLSNKIGLVNLLAEDVEIQDAIQRSIAEPNLFFLSAGIPLSEQSWFLSSKPIKNLMERVAENYDLIIYNTPSVLEYVDASIIAAETHGLILVSSLGQLKANQLEKALEQLAIAKIPIVGIVALQIATSIPLLKA